MNTVNALEIKNLTKEFADFSLNNVSFYLPSGCILGLIGENGAGKSTTIKLILDMLHKDGGSIKIFGKDNCENISLLKEDIGVVMDDIGIPGCLNCRQVEKIMKNIFKNWNSEDYAKYIKRLSVPINKPFKDYSRGTRMKLAIAVALSHNAKLLLLDEATSGLDPVVRDDVLDILYEFTRDESHSVLISSHIVSDLEKLCDYIVFIHNGQLMLFDEKDAVLNNYGVVYGSEEQISQLNSNAVKNKKSTPYGTQAVVLRSEIPQGTDVRPISLEELFVQMSKEESV